MSGRADAFWATVPLGRGVRVLERDERGLVALAKPEGMLSHPNQRSDEARSLIRASYHLDGEYFEWTAPDTPSPRRLWLLNRLDSATSGVILAATTAELAATVRAHFRQKDVRKIYHALVFGVPRQPNEIWKDRLAVDKRGGKIRTATNAGHVPAESAMTLVRSGQENPRLSLLQLEPRTGRSHQLRVQCAKRRLPIVGDQTYGDFAANREFAKEARTKRLFLHSSETSFEYTFHGARHRFLARAPLPAEFEAYL